MNSHNLAGGVCVCGELGGGGGGGGGTIPNTTL